MSSGRFRLTIHKQYPNSIVGSVELPQCLQLPGSLRAPERAFCRGNGANFQDAYSAAFGEAVERYSYVFQGNEETFWATASQLPPNSLNPDACNQFSQEQYKNREAWNSGVFGFPWIPPPYGEEEPIAWSPVWSLTHARKYFAPTQYCYFYSNQASERLLCVADSNGCASGPTMEYAVTHALLELIERDAIALWWTARTRRGALAFPKVTEVLEIVEEYSGLGRQILRWTPLARHESK